MALLGDTLKYDKVDFQNLEAKLQNELWELSQAWSKYIRLILSFTYFYQLSGHTWVLKFKQYYRNFLTFSVTFNYLISQVRDLWTY